MQKIASILLQAYLRRNPVYVRLNQFNFLSQYSWLQNVLEELRPELFPELAPSAELADAPIESGLGEPRLDELHELLGRTIRGPKGTYKLEAWLGDRGRGQLFAGTWIEAQQAVAIQVYGLRVATDPVTGQPDQVTAAQSRLRTFADQAVLKLADGRVQDFRVVRSLDAIADDHPLQSADWTIYPSYLVTEPTAIAPTLRTYLTGPIAPRLARQAIGQLLQSLDFIHRQKFVFGSGQIQPGFVHGNLSLDSVHWTEAQSGYPYLYLSDLRLWERCSLSLGHALPSIQATPELIQTDLAAVGQIGWSLLTGQLTGQLTGPPIGQPIGQPASTSGSEAETWPQVDVAFEALLQRLIGVGPPFNQAEEARLALLKLPVEGGTGQLGPASAAVPVIPARKFPWAALLAGLAAIGGLSWLLLRRPGLAEAQKLPIVCCLKDVSAVPEGDFVYSAVENGTWRSVIKQADLLQRGQTLTDVLGRAQEKLSLRYQPAPTVAEAIGQVQAGQADFAVVPLLDSLASSNSSSPSSLSPTSLRSTLPSDVIAQPIAYDGLAVVVNFSYANRQNSLPMALDGQIDLDRLRRLYTDATLQDWQPLTRGLPWIARSQLLLKRYLPENPDVLALFETRVLKSPLDQVVVDNPQDVAEADRRSPTPVLPMFRQIIRDFETEDERDPQGQLQRRKTGAIAISSISQIRGQCSVYPLAIAQDRQAPVQPLLLREGRAIGLADDLCDRKGSFSPDVKAFQTGRYPLAYPIAIVYPADNRRSAQGRKFAELMVTREGQRLLADAGLVPLEEPVAPAAKEGKTRP
jgi:hypothetical protein